jgi:hypothetical protein
MTGTVLPVGVPDIDRKDAIRIFRQFEVPGERLEMAVSRLDELAKLVREMKKDISAADPKDELGIRPQDQRERFKRLAEKLELIAEEILQLDVPRQRYRRDRDTVYVPPVGFDQFRRKVAARLAEVFDYSYPAKFGIDVRHATHMHRGSPHPHRTDTSAMRGEYTAEALEGEAARISADLIQQIAKGIRGAERLLKTETKAGPRANVIREFVLLNLVALWHDAFDGQNILYVTDARPELFEFCESLGGLLGEAEGFCTEHHLKVAIRDFKTRKGRKPAQKKG